MKNKRIGNIMIEFGRFPGETFKLFQLTILEIFDSSWKSYFHIQVGRWIFNINEGDYGTDFDDE